MNNEYEFTEYEFTIEDFLKLYQTTFQGEIFFEYLSEYEKKIYLERLEKKNQEDKNE